MQTNIKQNNRNKSRKSNSDFIVVYNQIVTEISSIMIETCTVKRFDGDQFDR